MDVPEHTQKNISLTWSMMKFKTNFSEVIFPNHIVFVSIKWLHTESDIKHCLSYSECFLSFYISL